MLRVKDFCNLISLFATGNDRRGSGNWLLQMQKILEGRLWVFDKEHWMYFHGE
jgi:hypothetical protein